MHSILLWGMRWTATQSVLPDVLNLPSLSRSWKALLVGGSSHFHPGKFHISNHSDSVETFSIQTSMALKGSCWEDPCFYFHWMNRIMDGDRAWKPHLIDPSRSSGPPPPKLELCSFISSCFSGCSLHCCACVSGPLKGPENNAFQIRVEHSLEEQKKGLKGLLPAVYRVGMGCLVCILACQP